ncbi:MAG TPA: alpha/beta hydrolase [Planctomycetota bacterium]|nr:alpha/beta hydrolase [Planctomycetota bacterium]
MPRSEGGPVAGTLCAPEDRPAPPPILFLREDSLAPEGLFYPTIVDRLAQSGFATAILDRREGHAIDPVEELDVSRAFVAEAAAGRIDPRLARGRVGVVGHGLGGAIALLVAAASGGESVPGVVTLGACAQLARGDGRMPPSFVDEVARRPDRYSLERAVRELRGRAVFVHGEEDSLVPIEEAERLYHWADKDRARLVIMEKVGHNFGTKAPFVGLTKEVDRIGKILVDFFATLL